MFIKNTNPINVPLIIKIKKKNPIAKSPGSQTYQTNTEKGLTHNVPNQTEIQQYQHACNVIFN